MSGYPGNYPPVTGHAAPQQPYQQQYQQTPQYPPQQQYPQQGYPPQGYPPQQPYAQAQAYPAYPPQQAYPAPGAYAASPYPAATGWAAPAAGYGAAYAAPAVGYAAAYAPVAAVAVAPMMAMPAMNYAFQLHGSHLDRKDIFSKSDPFVVLWASKHPGGYHAAHGIARRESKSTKKNKKFGGMSGNWTMIYRSETIMNNQHPTWAPFTVNLISLCGGNIDSVFKIEVWDSDVHSNHDFIGGAVTTIRELMTSKELRLVNKRRIGIHNSSGRIEVVRCAPC